MADFFMNDSDSGVDSEEELQEAFAKGLLKPGLNEIIEKETRTFTNNISEIKARLHELKLKLPWIETLDLVTSVAPMAPDVAIQMQETALRRKNIKENSKGNKAYDPAQDPVLNEFKRENLIHRQAQASVVEGISKLKALGISTKRPDDYFAEMAKSDDHMQKVRKNLLAKQAGQARAEKVRQLREQKKISKKVQIEAKLKQASEKKQMLDKLKRVRRGKSDDLDFLEDNPKKNKNTQNDRGVNKKRASKDKKFGFGGKKRGNKMNSRESSNDMSGFNSSSKGPKKNIKNFKPKGNNKKQRPGKARRKNTRK